MSPEFSRPISPARISAAGLVVTVTAEPEECASLAKRFGLPVIAALSCRFVLTAAMGDVYEARGELRASLTQTCVVSLDPFDAEIAEDFAVRFVPAGAAVDDVDPDPTTVDEIPYQDGVLDLGEATAEQLALVLDPYPRRPGAALAETEETTPRNPFAILARRRKPS